MGDRSTTVPLDRIENRILLIRGQRVILDADLAALYGVATKRLNEQVRRNLDRFPDDFVFQLNNQEVAFLRSQNATASFEGGHGGRRTALLVFTEHGAIMAASVLNSKQAVDMSIYVVRAFVKLREMLAANRELAHKLSELEHKVGKHDETIRSLVAAIRQLMTPPELKMKKIGFRGEGEK